MDEFDIEKATIMRVVPAYTPIGPIQRDWHANGYQAAMIDLYDKMLTEGNEGMREWVENNIRREN